MKGHCDSCNKESDIAAAHVGRVHQACGRKKGGGKERAGGKWLSGPAPRIGAEKQEVA